MNLSINIGIEDIGSEVLSGVANHFAYREKKYLDYTSFHQVTLSETTKDYTTFMNRGGYSFVNNNYDSNSIFIQKIYNDLNNLPNVLDLEVVPNIDLNIIFAAYDYLATQEAISFIKEINNLNAQGVINRIRVKCYSVLANGSGVVSEAEQKQIKRSLDQLNELKNQNLVVLDRVIIVDDKNTKTVYLGDGLDYIHFFIAETIIALMLNRYSILGNLPDSLFLGIGTSFIYFDHLYFNRFMYNRILRRTQKNEKIDEIYKYDLSNYTDLVENNFKPFCKDSIKGISLDKIEKSVEPHSYKYSLGHYNDFLALLLDKDVYSKKYIRPIDYYSIDDTIYTLLYELIIEYLDEDVKNEYISVVDYKKQEEELYIKREALEKTINAFERETIINEINDLEESLNNHRTRIKQLIEKYRHQLYQNEIAELPKKIEKEKIQKLEDISSRKKKETFNYNKRNFLCRLLNKGKYIRSISEIEDEYNSTKDKYEVLEKSRKDNIDTVKELYNFKGDIEEKYSKTINGIKSLKSLRRYEGEYLNYSYLFNVLDNTLMINYEEIHQDKLQVGLDGQLKKLFDAQEETGSFSNNINQAIVNGLSQIVDFDIVRYLNGDYDNMSLLKKWNFERDYPKLQQSCKPFFNSSNTYTAKQHLLKAYSDVDKGDIQKLTNELENYYPAALPGYIKVDNSNKFILVAVDVIENLEDIVKYNTNGENNK